LVDQPDGRRKLHARPIPMAGGPVLFVAVGVALAVVLCLPGPLHEQALSEAVHIAGLAGACLVICAVGVADDFGRLRGRHKLIGQLAAVGIVVTTGVEVHQVQLLGWKFDLGVNAVPFTCFFLLGAINSLNLIDGMDGLLSSIALIVCASLGVMAWLVGNAVVACAALAMAGSLLGFLRFNFPPASIFLGDSGSMLIGLVVGVLSIRSSLKGPAAVALATPLALLVIPIIDTTAAILRRKLTGRSIYCTDRGHLHHCLLRRLPSPRYVLLAVSACCLLTAAGAFVGLVFKNELFAVGTALAVTTVLVMTRMFGYAEFLLVKKRLLHLALSLMQGRGEGRFQRIDVHLHGTTNWKSLLDCIAVRAFDLNLQSVRLDVSAPALHEEYHAQWDRFEEEVEDQLWHTELPLLVGGRPVGSVRVSGYMGPEPLWVKVAAMTHLIEEFSNKSVSLVQEECAGESDQRTEARLAVCPPAAWEGSKQSVPV
jgi:UDP-GlcNAc:undecaprenyl-phosphate GlcNAc-1-phosphate transferase